MLCWRMGRGALTSTKSARKVFSSSKSYVFPGKSMASPKATSNVWTQQVGGRDVAKVNPALHTSQLPVRTAWVNIGFLSVSASQLANA